MNLDSMDILYTDERESSVSEGEQQKNPLAKSTRPKSLGRLFSGEVVMGLPGEADNAVREALEKEEEEEEKEMTPPAPSTPALPAPAAIVGAEATTENTSTGDADAPKLDVKSKMEPRRSKMDEYSI